VVIGRKHSLDSEWVRREIDVALERGDVPLIININEAIDIGEHDAKVASIAVKQHWLRIEEKIPIADGRPSDHCVGELIRSFTALRQDSKRLRVLSAVVVGFALLSLAASIAAWIAYDRAILAEEQTSIARSGEAISKAQLLTSESPDQTVPGLLLALESLQLSASATATDFASRMMEGQPRLVANYRIEVAPQNALISLNGALLAFRSPKNTLEIMNALSRMRIHQIDGGNSPNVYAISKDVKYIAYARNSEAVIHALGASALKSTFNTSSRITNLAFSQGSRYLVAEDTKGWTLWDVESDSLVSQIARKDRSQRDLTTITVFRTSPDKRTFVTGGNDGVVRLWSVETGLQIVDLKLDDVITDVVFSSDGKRIAIAAEKGTILVWSISGVQEIGRLVGLRGAHSIAFDNEARRLAVATEGGQAVLWEIESDLVVPVMTEKQQRITQLLLSPDAKFIVAAIDSEVVISEIGSDRRTARGFTIPVAYEKFVISPDSKWLLGVSGYWLSLWSLETGQQIWQGKDYCRFNKGSGYLPVPPEALIDTLIFSPDSRHVATSCNERDFKIDQWYFNSLWDVRSGNRRELSNRPSSLAFSEDSPMLAVAGFNSVTVHDLRNKKAVLSVEHEGRVASVDVSAKGNFLAVVGTDETVKIWEVATKTLVGHFDQDGPQSQIVFDPTESKLISFAGGKFVHIWDITARKRMALLEHHQSDQLTAQSLSIGAKGELAALSDRKTLTLLDLTTGLGRSKLIHSFPIDRMFFGPLDERLILESDGADSEASESVSLREVESWKELGQWTDQGRFMGFSPNGRFFALLKGSAVVLHMTTANQDPIRLAHRSMVQDMGFGPRRLLWTKTVDQAVHIWATESWAKIVHLPPQGPVNEVEIIHSNVALMESDASGNQTMPEKMRGVGFEPASFAQAPLVATVGDDGSTRIWDLEQERRMAEIVSSELIPGVVYRLSSASMSGDGRYLAAGRGTIWSMETGGVQGDRAILSAARQNQSDASASHLDVATWREVLKRLTFRESRKITRVGDLIPKVIVSKCTYFDGYESYAEKVPKISIWNLRTSERVHMISYDESIHCKRWGELDGLDLSISSDDRYLASGGGDGKVRIWELTTGELVAKFSTGFRADSVQFDSGGEFLLIEDEQAPQATILRSGDWTPLNWIALIGSPNHIAFRPNSVEVAVVSDDNAVRLMEIATGKVLREKLGNGSVDDIIFSADGDHLIIVFSTGAIRVWDIAGDKEISAVNIGEKVTAVALSFDGKYLATLGSSGKVQIWETTTVKELARLTSPSANSLAFSYDARALLVSYRYKDAAELWLWRPGASIAEICITAARDLTLQEWKDRQMSWNYSPVCSTFQTTTEDPAIQLPKAN
jgi:WD40 repeat protein